MLRSESDLAAKVAFLLRPQSYPDTPERVDVIETHFAWLFLSGSYVYKLHKPVSFPGSDRTSLQARRAHCELEMALNRRLAAHTYIGVVALGRRDDGLCLEYEEHVVDWLVKMHKLPLELSLEAQLAALEAADPRLIRLTRTLSEFYRRTARAPWNAHEYAGSLKRQTMRDAERCVGPGLESAAVAVGEIRDQQLAFVKENLSLLEARIAQERILDAHGDLRPEHIFLTEPTQIIDCLEFSSELRLLDSAEEISFLALECERLGRKDIGERLFELYLEGNDDCVDDRLCAYYRSRRALVRAFVSAWHLKEDLEVSTSRRWLERSRWYIDIARSSIARALR